MYLAALLMIVSVSRMVQFSSAIIPEAFELDSELAKQRFAEFYCYKLKSCTPGGPPVCGFDDNKSFLAEFEDVCTLYKINCQRIGIFTLVEENICTGQKRFEADTKAFNLPLEFLGKQNM